MSEETFSMKQFLKVYLKVVRANREYRYGQALFTALEEYYPSAADQVRGTDLDPYEEEEYSSPGVVDFLKFLEKQEGRPLTGQ